MEGHRFDGVLGGRAHRKGVGCKAARSSQPEQKEQHELAEAYFRAIAVEITKNTPDEELAEME